MAGIRQLNIVVLSIMVAVTIVNMGLLVNFITASGRALAALFNGESIFLFAAVELAAVLLAYIFHKQKTSPHHA
ncbi:MAG: hypothetical protein KDI17_14660 [Halioglobus sp.]|nr:hypothetical protein [Halioglobus sp.]